MAEGKGFEMRITQTGGGEIYIGTEDIKSVSFSIDTYEENVKDRSENIINKVVVKGSIRDEDKAATKDLLLWSMETESEQIYRNVEITARKGETTRLRKYTMNKVFCIDYVEELVREGDSTFVLTFAQRKDNLDGIEVIC